ncbi:hypothetical protein C1646_703838 [Rhizophagus diaphanus]|nr:hypothetical protein C1646_703838 [Rhizophagus diaphanus] [Rhizophagus sp. MUCL 43196]
MIQFIFLFICKNHEHLSIFNNQHWQNFFYNITIFTVNRYLLYVIVRTWEVMLKEFSDILLIIG